MRRHPHTPRAHTVISDGQFQKAGFPEDRIVECHGSIHYLQCALPCSRGELAPAPASLDLAVDPETFQVRRVESSRIERDTHAHTGLRRIQASSPSAHRAVAASHDRTYSCSMTLTGRALAPPLNPSGRLVQLVGCDPNAMRRDRGRRGHVGTDRALSERAAIACSRQLHCTNQRPRAADTAQSQRIRAAHVGSGA